MRLFSTIFFQYDGVDYFNTYRPCDLAPIAGNSGVVEAVQNHIKHLLTDEREREILTSYLAHNVQFPRQEDTLGYDTARC